MMAEALQERDQARKAAETSLDELAAYAKESIQSDATCQKNKWACQRFLRDIERQGKNDFPWVFDVERANRFLRWMPFFRHTKGPLAGKRKIPELLEKFIFGNLYGWVHIDNGRRRFRKGYWQIARKNAKSQDMAIAGLYEISAFGEASAEAYIAATKKDQTRYVWGEARVLVEKCPELKGKIFTKHHDDLGTKVIMHPKSNSFFARLSEEDAKKGDGANPQFMGLDEYHAHPTSEFYDLGTSGMKTRTQPLLMIITTAGFDLNNPCYRDEYLYVSAILNPDSDVENDRYFIMINELDTDDEGNLIDDITDQKTWLKCNPILAKTQEGIESITDELKVAQDKPEKMRDFLTKTMNVWVNQRSCGYMNMAKWKLCCVEKGDIPEHRGLDVYCGFDLSSSIDLTSIGFEIPLPDERILVFSHSFMPEATLFERVKGDKYGELYKRWVREKWITKTEGSEVDYRYMIKYMKEFCEEHELIIAELCFDRYLAAMLMQEMKDEGYEAIGIPQGIPTLSIPTKDFRAKTYDKKLVVVNNPVLNFAVGNAVTRKDHNGNIMLDKSKSIEKIDPIAAIMNSHVRVLLKEQNSNVYNRRGMLSLLD